MIATLELDAATFARLVNHLYDNELWVGAWIIGEVIFSPSDHARNPTRYDGVKLSIEIDEKASREQLDQIWDTIGKFRKSKESP